MKSIYLVRHGEAKTDSDCTDFARQLTKRGIKDSIKIARLMKRKGIRPDLFISSPAHRAIETAYLVARELGYPTQTITARKALFEGSVDDLPGLIQNLDINRSVLVIVGHNPILTDFAHMMAERYHESIPKAGVVGIEFLAETWADILPGTGLVVFSIAPTQKESDKKKRSAFTRHIEAIIYDRLREVLESEGVSITDELDQRIQIYSWKLARRTARFASLPEKHKPAEEKKATEDSRHDS